MAEKSPDAFDVLWVNLEVKLGRGMPEEVHIHLYAGFAQNEFGDLRRKARLGLALPWSFGKSQGEDGSHTRGRYLSRYSSISSIVLLGNALSYGSPFLISSSGITRWTTASGPSRVRTK